MSSASGVRPVRVQTVLDWTPTLRASETFRRKDKARLLFDACPMCEFLRDVSPEETVQLLRDPKEMAVMHKMQETFVQAMDKLLL
jgi:hypothetical protein